MRYPMTAIGILGPRNQDLEDIEPNKVLIANITAVLDAKYTRPNYYMVTIGCDKGFGKHLFSFCAEHKIKLVQFDTFLLNARSDGNSMSFGTQQDCLSIFKSRHAGVLELCTEFHIKMHFQRSLIDDLVDRVKASTKLFYLYDFENNLIEKR